MENIVENNKLLAEFLGYSQPHPDYPDTTYWYKKDCQPLTILLFHSHWDWLMRVVEKIENLEHCQIDISLNWCRIGYKGTLFNYDSRDYFKGIAKIEAVYTACVKFVKWFNEQKK